MKTRLDILLVENKHYAPRSRARDAISRGCIRVNGKEITKPGTVFGCDVALQINDPAGSYVSRAALKLEHGFSLTKYNIKHQTRLDIGASTGGFTQLLLQHGAKRVFALDVGHGQLDESIASDPRVTEVSNVNVRDLTLEHLENKRPEFLVADVSFISLKLALPPALGLAATGAKGIFLVKPQFEVGRENIGKGGLVRDAQVAENTGRSICKWLENEMGWRAPYFDRSPISGSDGNCEFIVGAEKVT